MFTRFTQLMRLGAVAVLASAVVPVGPAHANSADIFTLPANGTVAVRQYPPGLYTVTVWGVYDYNDNVAGSYADAFCSTLGPGNTVDRLAQPQRFMPSPVATWEPERYAELAPGADPLAVEVDGLPTAWVPAPPTPISYDGAVGPPGVGSACNEATHTYATTLVSTGGLVTFRVFDPVPTDNVGNLTVEVSSLL